MAQKAGLFPPKKDQYYGEKTDPARAPWLNYNNYWDEKSIDVQWRRNEKQWRLREFEK